MRGRISPRDNPHQFTTKVLGTMDPFHLRLYATIAKHESKQTRAWCSLNRRERVYLRIWAGLVPGRYPTSAAELSRILDCSESNAWYGINLALQKLGLGVVSCQRK